MSEQLSEAAAVWYQAMSVSERSLRPIPKHPEAQLYRRMTILSDAMTATVEAGLASQNSLNDFYAKVDQARVQAQIVPFDQLSPTEALDAAEQITDGLVAPTLRILYPNLGGKKS